MTNFGNLKKFSSSTLLILLAITFSMIAPRFSHAATCPCLLFSNDSLTVQKGDEFSVNIIIDTAGKKIGGAGVKFEYNQKDLKVLDVVATDIFDDYPIIDYDNDDGRGTISGVVLSPDDLYSGRDVVGYVTFKALRTGTSKVEFDFSRGSTKDSNLASTSGNGDILQNVNVLTVKTTNSTGRAPVQVTTPIPAQGRPRSANLYDNAVGSTNTTYPTNTDEPQEPISNPEPSQEPVTSPISSLAETDGNADQNSGWFSNYWYVGLMILAVILIIGGIFYLFRSREDQSDESYS